MTKENFKRYVFSSLITFLAIFLPLLIGAMKEFDIEGFTVSTLVAFLAVGFRLIVKALWETGIILFTSLYNWVLEKINRK